MILLTVKTNDLKKDKVKAADYAKAWFRLQNEDTNQTLDYSYINAVKEENEMADDEEGDGDADADGDGEEDEEQPEKIE